MVIISRRRHSINDLVEDNLYLLFYDVRVVGLNVTAYIKKYIMHVFGLKLAILDFYDSDDLNTLNAKFMFHFLNNNKNVPSFQHH